MSLTTITGQVKKPDDTYYAEGAEVHFDLLRATYTPDTQFAATRSTAVLDATGNFSIDLFPNEEGEVESYYRCITPDRKYFDFTLPVSNIPLDLSVLRQGGITEQDPQYNTLITYINENFTNEATWVLVTSNATLQRQRSYFVDSLSLVTLTLPTSATLGDRIGISNIGVGGFRIAQNSDQQIRVGDKITTVGITGRIDSTDYGDAIEIVYKGENLWVVTRMQGNLNVA